MKNHCAWVYWLFMTMSGTKTLYIITFCGWRVNFMHSQQYAWVSLWYLEYPILGGKVLSSYNQDCMHIGEILKGHRPVGLPLWGVTSQLSTGWLSAGQLSTGQLPLLSMPLWNNDIKDTIFSLTHSIFSFPFTSMHNLYIVFSHVYLMLNLW